ncbi:conserved hypothetical protein [Frankia canadensis]|uniref:Uncharacterized protein n=1 Tax=Frankia canadensis TaxID=1836972 RepID=A0A2I2KW78_9ACTN|nr:gephyrin-like molybdotransferase receptor GlpR [Frankia canadensis]SNQ49919.1 conserved hypothetical protein [Frankia canadensis]SOU57209.1 conserved hypothetical protein [Frankia canadensis]
MSALIWVAIVAVWGFVLIPMWLRRHDTLSEQRSTERFTVAMRVLSRRPPLDDEAAAAADVGGVGGTAMSHVEPSHVELPDVELPDVELPGGELPHVEPGSTGGPFAERATPVRPAATGTPPASTGPRTPRPLGARSAPEPRADTRAESRSDTRPDARSEPRRPAAATSGPSRRVSAERATLMRVRRQRLTVLGALFPLTVILAAVFGGLWIAVQLLTDLGITAYLVHLRRAAQIERRLEVTRAAIERRIEAERAARGRRRPVGSSFAYHERDGLDALTPEELAHAQAETIDLGALMSEAPRTSELPAGYRAAPDLEGAYGVAAGHADSGGHATVLPNQGAIGSDHAPDSDQAFDAGHADQVFEGDRGLVPGHALGAEHGLGTQYAADADEVEATAARTPSRSAARPAARPTTSRPGRVQINPPGTHGGLTAPPSVEPAPAPVADPAAPEELDDPLLRRHAVGS